MKNFKKIPVFIALALSCCFLHAVPAVSGVASGNIGIDGKIPFGNGSMDWKVPISLFGALQVDFTEWFTLRAEIEMRARNFPITDVFSGSEGIFKVHELSTVFSSRASSATHYFSIFFGSYEAIGTDTFLMRQFGMEQISSPLTKSVTNIAGIPLHKSSGAGISYIAHTDKAPVATGFYAYLNKYNTGKLALNLDYRLALASEKFTMDFVAGLGAPIRDKDEISDEYVIAIKTLNLHGGINMLVGNKYTHGLLLQAGLKELILNGKNSFNLEGDNISFLIEPRLRFRTWGLNVTGYALSQESVNDLLYLTDQLGGGITLFFDNIETTRSQILAGIHLIASLSDLTLLDLIGDADLSNLKLNAYVTPYIEVAFNKNAKLEVMLQLGALNILQSTRAINFKTVVGFRKQF